MYEMDKQTFDGRPTANRRVLEPINACFEPVKPLFDAVSVDVVELTAESYSRGQSTSRRHGRETSCRQDYVSRSIDVEMQRLDQRLDDHRLRHYGLALTLSML